MKKSTNQGKAVFWGGIAVVIYAIPLIVLAILKSDQLFSTPGTGLTFFSVAILFCFVLFAKKVVSALTKVFTKIGFWSIFFFLIVLAIQSFVNMLVSVAIANLCSAVLAWYPMQISGIYNQYAYDENGEVLTDRGMTFKEANAKFLNISFTEN